MYINNSPITLVFVLCSLAILSAWSAPNPAGSVQQNLEVNVNGDNNGAKNGRKTTERPYNKAGAPASSTGNKGGAAPKNPAAAASSADNNRKPKPTSKFVTCTSCRGLGDDCKSNKVYRTCDKCVKMTGIASDPSSLNEQMLEFVPDGDQMRTLLTLYKGKKVTIRGCATDSAIAFATFGQEFAPTGCSAFDELFGLKDCTACLCDGDCK